MTYSRDTKDKFIELRARGCTLASTARELNISYNTAVNWNKELCEEVTAAKAFNIEEMREKYLMTTEKRMEMYGERLKAIQQELAKRDLSAIPTHKLFEMMIKCEAALNAEVPDPKFMTAEEIKDEKDLRRMKAEREKMIREYEYT